MRFRGGFGGALVWLYPRIDVAFTSQSPPNHMAFSGLGLALHWLCVALGGLVRLRCGDGGQPPDTGAMDLRETWDCRLTNAEPLVLHSSFSLLHSWGGPVLVWGRSEVDHAML
jgi:hypothetical protein